MTVKGAIVASAVAGLFAAATPAVVHAKDAGKVKCSGINDCKGKGACKSATSSCKGMNDCKGKGWIETLGQGVQDQEGHRRHREVTVGLTERPRRATLGEACFIRGT